MWLIARWPWPLYVTALHRKTEQRGKKRGGTPGYLSGSLLSKRVYEMLRVLTRGGKDDGLDLRWQISIGRMVSSHGTRRQEIPNTGLLVGGGQQEGSTVIEEKEMKVEGGVKSLELVDGSSGEEKMD